MTIDPARTTVGREVLVVLEEQGRAIFASPTMGRTLRVQPMLRAVISVARGYAEDGLEPVQATSLGKAAGSRFKPTIIAGLD